MQSGKMSRKIDRPEAQFQGRIPVKSAQRVPKVMQGQPFIRNTTKDSTGFNGINETSPQRKSGRKYETFVMTGDMIIRTTSEQNTSDSETKLPAVKNKQHSADTTTKDFDSSTKRKKVENSSAKSKLPKPSHSGSNIRSPKVLAKNFPSSKEPLVLSPNSSPLITQKYITKDPVSPKLNQKQSPQHRPPVVHSPQGSPKLKTKSSPSLNTKQVSGIPQKKAQGQQHLKVVKESNVSEGLSSAVPEHPVAIPTGLVSKNHDKDHFMLDEEKYSSNQIISENASAKLHSDNQIEEQTFNGKKMDSCVKSIPVKKSHIPMSKTSVNRKREYSPSPPRPVAQEQLPFGYNNPTHISNLIQQQPHDSTKRSPFEYFQRPVYHTCAAMPIELDIPPDDICSEDEQYNRFDDEFDMDDLPPPPDELLQDFIEEKDSPTNNLDNGIHVYNLMSHNQVFQERIKDELAAKKIENSSPQQQPLPPLQFQSEQCIEGNAINYSSPVQQCIGTKMNSVINSVQSQFGKSGEVGGNHNNVDTYAVGEENSNTALKDLNIIANDSLIKTAKESNTYTDFNSAQEKLQSHNIVATEQTSSFKTNAAIHDHKVNAALEDCFQVNSPAPMIKSPVHSSTTVLYTTVVHNTNDAVTAVTNNNSPFFQNALRLPNNETNSKLLQQDKLVQLEQKNQLSPVFTANNTTTTALSNYQLEHVNNQQHLHSDNSINKESSNNIVISPGYVKKSEIDRGNTSSISSICNVVDVRSEKYLQKAEDNHDNDGNNVRKKKNEGNDIHEDYLDNVLESQAPMDTSFNVPTPLDMSFNTEPLPQTSEYYPQDLLNNTTAVKTNNIALSSYKHLNNLPSNNKNADSAATAVINLDHLNDTASKFQSNQQKSDYITDTIAEIDALDNKESLANVDDEPRRGMVTSISGEGFGYKTLPSSKGGGNVQSVGGAKTGQGRNQSPALVRSSKSHENYLDDKDMTMIDIDFGDDIASSVDALHYDQSCTSLDNFNGYHSNVAEQSKSLDNSPQRRYEKHSQRIHMPTFFSIEEPRSITKLREGVKVKDSSKRESGDSSASSSYGEVSPTHDAYISEEQQFSPTLNIKSEGSSPIHEFFPNRQAGDSVLIQKIIAAEKTQKKKQQKPTMKGFDKCDRISKSAESSPVHQGISPAEKRTNKHNRSLPTADCVNGQLIDTSLTIQHHKVYPVQQDENEGLILSPQSDYDYENGEPSQSSWNSLHDTNPSDGDSGYSAAVNFSSGSIVHSRSDNVNANNNDSEIENTGVTNTSVSPSQLQQQNLIQEFTCEPKSPRKIYQNNFPPPQSYTEQTSSENNPSTPRKKKIKQRDGDITNRFSTGAPSPSQDYIGNSNYSASSNNDFNNSNNELVTQSSPTSKPSPNKSKSPKGKKIKSDQLHLQPIDGQNQTNTVSNAHYSPTKHKRDKSDRHQSPIQLSSQPLEQEVDKHFDQDNEGPPPPYSLTPVFSDENSLSVTGKSSGGRKITSPRESPTKHYSPGLSSPQKDYPVVVVIPSHKPESPQFESPVQPGSGPSSPDSDTGSIYHQPLKDVDVPSAQRLAKRLYELDGFKKHDISKHLSKKNDFAQQVGEEFLKYFDFSDEGLDASLRKFLKHITLAGETQERERVLVHFSKRFMECNRESFNSEDAAHTLTCALLLLNTDLHGENVNQKMSVGEFIENLSDLNDGENFPKEILKSLYFSIKTEPLEWEFDEASTCITQDFDLLPATNMSGQRAMPAESQQKYLGHNPFLDVPDPNKTTDYKKGYVMRKCVIDPDGRKTAVGKRGWKMLYVILKDMILYLYKDEHAYKKNSHYDNMSNAIRVHHALASKAIDYKKKQHVLRLLPADSSEYLFQSSNPEECQSWIDSLNFVAALYSAPPLPGAVGSQKKFQRPLLPASYTRLNMREQYQHHEQRVTQIDRELQEHRKYPPEKGSKSRIIQDYIEKEQYLQHELRRFKTYCFQLQNKLTAYPELEPSLVETAICEVSEPPSPNTEHRYNDSAEPPLGSPKKSPKKSKSKSSTKSESSSTKEREKKTRSAVGRSHSDREEVFVTHL